MKPLKMTHGLFDMIPICILLDFVFCLVCTPTGSNILRNPSLFVLIMNWWEKIVSEHRSFCFLPIKG